MSPRRLPVAVLALLAAAAHAAGGHHAVDDAAILDPGQCEIESWFTRAPGEKALHAGAGCRVGPVELGFGADHARAGGASATGWQLQAKWAAAVNDALSLGVAFAPGWAAHARPRYQGSTLALLATWKAGETVTLHANAGRDFVHQGGDASRGGIAAEWAPREGWTLMAERYVEDRSHFLRAGVRWSATDRLSLDVSRAHRLAGGGASTWTLGVTWLLEH